MTDKFIFRMRKKEVLKIAIGILAGILFGGILVACFACKLERKREASEPTEKIVVVAKESDNVSNIDRVTVEYVSGKLENIGKLSTAEMVYSAICTVGEGSIPFITKNGFSMVYSARIRAGINVNEIEIMVTEETVNVVIPKAEIDTLHVLPDSITFFDSKFALFNWTTKEDVTTAIALAESDLSKAPDIDALIERANENAMIIIESILKDSIDDKTLNVSFRG